MRIAPQTLLEGVVRTLHEEVIPHLESGTARGQLWAAIDVLRNLGGRIEAAIAAQEAEASSAAAALATLAARLQDAGETGFAAEIEGRLAEANMTPVGAKRAALRDALGDAFTRLEALPGERADALRSILGGHLAAQAVRDLAWLQPSLLEEISRG